MLRIVLAALGLQLSCSGRFNRMLNAGNEEGKETVANRADKIACPVMAGLVHAGTLKLDSQGRATQKNTMEALMWMGNKPIMANFQAAGAAAYKKNDVHQEYRERAGNYDKGDLYLNFNIMNPISQCKGNNPNGRDGLICNANMGFQQHGYSTTIRDPTDGSSRRARMARWLGVPGVLTNISGVSEEVMTIKGMGALLKEARLHGDVSGEFGINKDGSFKGSQLSYYHPAASSPDKYNPCFQWQGIGAWAAFWAVFAREKGGVYYMPLSDLERFFLKGKFPKDYSPKPWGFKETMKTIRELRGTGAGEQWVAIISGILGKVGENGPEKHYAGGLLAALTSVGARSDDVHRSFSR